MPVLDFKEIAQANLPTGKQDSFELFARDFLKAMGLEILEGPSRGADDGMDLIAIETQEGPLGKINTKWLVSCKHYAHSGKSVYLSDKRTYQIELLSINVMALLVFIQRLRVAG